MAHCADRYGDSFTLRLAGERPWVMVSHPDTVREVFNGPPDLLHAGEGNRILLPVVGANSVLLLDGDAHREQRRLLVPPFRGHHLASYAKIMTAVAKAAVAEWPRGKVIRLHPRMKALTLDMILRTVFGLSEGSVLDELRAELVRTTMSPMATVGQTILVLNLPGSRDNLIRRHFRKIDQLLHAEIAERRRAVDTEERTDVLSILLQARHADGSPMSDTEVRDELITLLTAGHDTTASALAWAVEGLARDPGRQARLAEEVRAGGSEYVDATIKETLRLRPVLSQVARQLKAPMNIGGMSLPAEVTVVPSIYLMHRRPDVYPDPELFRPERFLEQRAGTHTWIPFGGGVRRCLGAAFAELEMRIVLSTLFEGCTVRPARSRAEPPRRQGITHVPGRGAKVILS